LATVRILGQTIESVNKEKKMERKLTRIIISAVLLVTLCATITAPAYAGDGQKLKAYGAGKTYSDFSIIGYPEIGELVGLINFHLDAPDEGYYNYRCLSGTYEGSWAHTAVNGLFFGTYNGPITELHGLPVVYFWGEITAGENLYSSESPASFPIPPYQKLEGWYKVGGFVDGGPGHENDYQLAMMEIPPEGLPLPGLPPNGGIQAQLIFNAVVAGWFPLTSSNLITGNIRIK
jgi:hypothetical protein